MDLPIENFGSVHSYVTVYQRVKVVIYDGEFYGLWLTELDGFTGLHPVPGKIWRV